MLPYKLGSIFILMLALFASQVRAEPAEGSANNEESVFDLVENPDESRGDSPFDQIGAGHDAAPDPGTHGYYNSAKIVAINKITAKSRQITVEIGKSSYFDNIELKLYKCWKSSDPYIQNNQILISVLENKFDEDPKLIFEGWLISLEPALSTFEHPVYEVLAVDCTGSKEK